MNRRVSGRSILYHYLQKVVIPREDAFAHRLVTQLICDLSIWMPPELFAAAPVLLPFAVREAGLKRNEWGTANAQGCLRDNNNLLKNLVAGWKIRSPRLSVYHGAGRGRGFVACHAWRRARLNGAVIQTTADPRTYSFIPNLAWLPDPISRLTDVEGSLAQQVLQAVSRRLYAPLCARLPEEIRAVFGELEDPALQLEIDLAALNYFEVTPRGIKTRRTNLIADMRAIRETLERGVAPARPVRSRRYLPSLLRAADPRGLLDWLGRYEACLLENAGVL